MSDGYSDKSVSPIVYQPAADNDPQAIPEEFVDDSGLTRIPLTALGSTLSPVVNLYATRLRPQIPVAGELFGAALLLTETTGLVFTSLKNVRSYNFETDTVGDVIGTIPTGLTWSNTSQVLFLDFLVKGTNVLAILGYTTAVEIWRSTNSGTGTWKIVWSHVSSGGNRSGLNFSQNADGSIIFATGTFTSGTTLVSAISTDGGATFSDSTLTVAAAYNSVAAVKWVTGNTWILIGRNTTSTNQYYWKSTDNCANWVLKQTTATATVGNDIVVGANNVLLFNSIKSEDIGESWTANTNGNFHKMIYLGGGHYYGILATNGLMYDSLNAFADRTLVQPTLGVYAAYVATRTWQSHVVGKSALFNIVDTLPMSLWYLRWGAETFVTLPSFSVTAPAKLSAILTATAQLVTAGKSGTVKLYLQHTNEAITTASSLADVAGAWTDCGALTHDTPLSLPSFTARAGEVIYPRLGFTCTDATGVSPAPELSSIAFAWSSDVIAPGEPTVTRIVNTSGSSSYGYRVDFGDLPATARYLIVEGSKNSAAYVPFNDKAQWAAGTHMKLRGSRDAVEEAGERNETSLSSNTGFVLGDTAQVKVAAEDDLGNRSAFVESEVITMSSPVLPSPYMFLSASSTTCELGDSITLSWDSANAATVVCDHDIGAVAAGDPLALSGSQAVSPEEDTVYTFTATNATSDTDIAAVTIDVIPATPGTYVPVLIDNVSIVVSERDEIKIEVES